MGCRVADSTKRRNYGPCSGCLFDNTDATDIEHTVARFVAPVVVGGDAVPFAEGSVAQPGVAFIPVLTARCVVEGSQGFPVRPRLRTRGFSRREDQRR